MTKHRKWSLHLLPSFPSWSLGTRESDVCVKLRLRESHVVDGMNTQRDKKSPSKDAGRKWPWWEPHVFTAGVLAALVVLMIACGYITRIPFVEHILFALMTIAAIIQVVRRSSTATSVGGNVALSVFFGLASLAYSSKSELLLGIEYSVLSVIWLALAIHAGVIRHRMRKERLARLDRAVDTLRGVFRDDQ